MPLSIAERKHRMPYGAQREIATAFSVSEAYVSNVMSGDVRPKTEAARTKLREVEEALAAKISLPVEDVFPAIVQETQQEAPPMAEAS